MPLVAAAVCPHPPMIVPEIASGAAPELDELRAACDVAVGRLAASGARSLLVLGGDSSTMDYNFPVRPAFARWGLPEPPGEPPSLPLSLSVGAWLINRAFVPVPEVIRRFATVSDTAPVEECVTYARRLGSDVPWALLVMGDGSARRGTGAPGYDDQRARPYDEMVERALATADLDALLGLDPVLSADLMVAGRAPWQVLAAAAAGGEWRATMEYSGAPYGVAYFVASWERVWT
ncbi:class III extradiol dioxygenase subunit B-like domain-containing protein [Phytohabitans kaempferiae]|uniref:Class III extradiol dioxygenase subunit B-like domain-containing protein n=1 Tax=Phytohabitans kaempferiae TaxID=1620943 RepID=A0ABV6M8Z5_9ACTN